jgi:hypothetical protein
MNTTKTALITGSVLWWVGLVAILVLKPWRALR